MTLTNRRDAEEQIDPRVVAAIRAATRAEQDDEYESSTPGAGRWRERIGAPRHDHGPTAGEISDDEVLGADARTTRLAQRHRFGRALDLPPAEPRDGIERGIIWAAVVGVALWGIFALIWWLA